MNGIRQCGLVLIFFMLSGCEGIKQTAFETLMSMSYDSADLVKKSVQVAEHQVVYVEREGQTPQSPTIVLVHGFGADKSNWPQMVKAIPAGFHVVALDLPGFGESSYHEEESYGFDAQAKRLNEFTRELGIESAHWVGNSMGGGIILELAQRYPQRVLSMTLMDAAGLDDPATQSDYEIMLASGDNNPLIVQTPEDFKKVFELVAVEPPFMPWPIPDVLAQRAAERQPRLNRIFAEISAQVNTSDPSYLETIKTPALVMWGKQDRILDVSNGRLMSEHLANAKLVVYDNVGHIPMIEVPVQAATDLVTFIENL